MGLEPLLPLQRRRVIDLVRDAGVDVADWSNYEGGAARAATNPRYCYEWSFYVPGKLVVLNVWHAQLREADDTITLTDNLRETADFYADVHGKAVWRKRAESFDRHVALAATHGLPIRLIVCDGRMRAKFDTEAKASSVRARELDSSPWAVASYDHATGRFVLRRGPLPFLLKDQFVTDPLPGSPTETKSVTGTVFVRSAAVRLLALKRADGRCEWCGMLGFTTDDGAVFLETHHVIPLSEEGPDIITNVVALCANHHREAHFGSSRATIRSTLLSFLKTGKSRPRGHNEAA